MLSRRTFLGAGAALPLVARVPATKRPNILLIVADDLGKEGLGPYGSGRFSTPALDRLAARGRTFTRFYVAPSCSPTRATLMTGLYGSRTGWLNNLERQPSDNRFLRGFPTIASVLRDAGYRTAIAGKWHLGSLWKLPNHPRSLGFRRSCLSLNNARTGLWGVSLMVDGERRDLPPRIFGPDFQVAWLQDFMRGPEPWFAVMMHDLPHQPFERTPVSSRDFGWEDPRNVPAMVQYMDKLTGDLMAPGDALTIFCTDNGGTVHAGGGKLTFTEAGINVPFIARWPGVIPPGTRDHGLCEACDLLPTFADVSGMGAPVSDGTSLLRSFRGRSRPKPFVFSQLKVPQLPGWPWQPEEWTVVERRYKLVGDHLYDLLLDPTEESPMVGRDNIRERLQQIAGRLL